jgi:hypothetical protein
LGKSRIYTQNSLGEVVLQNIDRLLGLRDAASRPHAKSLRLNQAADQVIYFNTAVTNEYKIPMPENLRPVCEGCVLVPGAASAGKG